MTHQEVMRLALEALEEADKLVSLDVVDAAIEALREALSQQGEQQPVGTIESRTYEDGTPAGNVINWVGRNAENDFHDGTKLYAAAPAAQPTCKQDLQVPVETEQERYVRMCPDIECGRKKQCTRMVGVSCMSRADIGAHGIGADK